MLLSRPTLVPPPLSASTHTAPGQARLEFCRSGAKTVLARSFSTSPLRVLAPRNHGHGSWIFLSNLGGGLVDGDNIAVQVDARRDTSVLLGTQASTKVYRSPHGCSQGFSVRVAAGAAVAMVPDPIVCFEGARYTQSVHVTLEGDASVVLFDAYTCGRAARGERWKFERFESSVHVEQDHRALLVDKTVLDGAHGDISVRMGPFSTMATLIAVGPRFAPVRLAMLARQEPPDGSALVAPSPVGSDAAILRVAAKGFECASHHLRSSFAALTDILGDDPFARKW
jgi:urease accessory protein